MSRAVKYKVGDRVMVNRDDAACAPVKRGQTGVVRRVYSPDYDVEMDHDGDRWLFTDSEIDPVPHVSTKAHVVNPLAAAIAAMQSFVVRKEGAIAKRKGVVLSEPRSPRCECGSDSVGSPMHSSWCPKHA